MLHRQRNPERDDLFSNWWQTTAPQVALFMKFTDSGKCEVMLGGQDWIVETKNIRHNTMEMENVN